MHVQQYQRFRTKGFCESISFDVVRLMPKIAVEMKVLDAIAPSLMPPTLKAVVVLAGAILQREEKKEPTDWSESFQNDMKEANLSLACPTKLLTYSFLNMRGDTVDGAVLSVSSDRAYIAGGRPGVPEPSLKALLQAVTMPNNV